MRQLQKALAQKDQDVNTYKQTFEGLKSDL
jgi:hypothetical protein